MPTVSLSTEEAATQLIRSNTSWSAGLGQPATVSYAYRASAPDVMPADTAGFVRFSEQQILRAERAFLLWSDVANISFVRVGTGTTGDAAYSNDATILLADYTTGRAGSSAFSFFPGSTNPLSPAGDMWHNINFPLNAFLHENGHAVGLSHPSDYDSSSGQPLSYETDASYIQDSQQYTVMSYFDQSETGAVVPIPPSGPQMDDIAAIQLLYGANYNTRSGDTVYGFNSNTNRDYMMILSSSDACNFCIWDGGGIDTIDMSGYSQGARIDLHAESFSDVGGWIYNLSIARGAIIENAIGGSGNDTLTGNDVDNVLDGRAGADPMAAGLGDDTYIVDNAGDVVTENVGEGADTIRSSISIAALAANVENLVLLAGAINGTGNALNNIITGNSAANTLFGGAGADTLLGGDGNDTLWGQAGADAMTGGLGDDTYVVESSGDVVSEASGEGTDTVNAFISYALPVNIENLLLLGIITNGTGNALNNTITGNTANNTLFGLNGADTLYGLDGNDTLYGGAGIDVMIGGIGNDAYYVESAGDVITELSGEGADIVNAWVSFVLPANIENLTLLGVITDGTGNGLDNIITGNGANNNLFGLGGADTLYGLAGNDALYGGAGADTMIGGTGNDAYNVDNAGDVVVENASEGTDTVNTFISGLTLAANVENLTLLGSVATGTGNALANILTGNTAANTLDGGAGADTLIGASGNDSFVFHAGQADGDTITDFDGQGANPGDSLSFSGYGAEADGASFVQLDATHWQINSADGTIHDVITLANGASVDPSDYVFG